MFKRRFWHSVAKSVVSVLAVLYLIVPTAVLAGTAQPGITPIAGVPWVWFVAADDSYQTVPAADGTPGVFYPTGADYPPPSSTADLGWVVRVGGPTGSFFGPDFNSHAAGSNAGGMVYELGTAYVPLLSGNVSAVTGSGTATDPFQVESTTPFGAVPLTKVTRVRYVDGTDYATYEIAITNTGSTAQTTEIFFAGGFPSEHAAAYDAASGTVGVTDCQTMPLPPKSMEPSGTVEPMLGFKPLTPADFYTVTQQPSFSLSVWSQIAFDPTLDNMVSPAQCAAGATAGLQWNRTIQPGETAVIQVVVDIFASGLPNPFDLAAVVPASGMQGETLSAAIDGSGFLDSTTFDFGTGIAVTSTMINSESNATVGIVIDPAAPIGNRDVTAIQAVGGEQAVLLGGFSVTAAATPLSLVSLAPDSGDPGAGYSDPELEVTVTGTGFDTSLALDFGAGITLSGVLVQNETTATAYLLIAPGATPGPRDVVATQGSETSTLANGFIVNSAGQPLVLVSISPNSALAGTSNVPVTLTGSGFLGTGIPGASLVFDFGTDILVHDLVVQSDTSATATLSISPAATLGPRDVIVLYDTQSSTLTDGFTVGPMTTVLSLTGVSPASGALGDTNLPVTITGSGFDGGGLPDDGPPKNVPGSNAPGSFSIDFGPDITVTNLVVQSDTTATATLSISPAAAAGPRDVIATYDTQSSTLTDGFTVGSVTIPLTLTGVSPAWGAVGTTSLPITVTGSGFMQYLVVDFGPDITVSNVVVQSGTTATASLAIGITAATGLRDVTVSDGDYLQSATLPNGFRVDPQQAAFDLTSVSPAQGQQGVTQIAAIGGTGFAPGMALDFGAGILVSDVTVFDSERARATLSIASNAPLGSRTVKAMQIGGATASLPGAFTVVAPPPPPPPGGSSGTLLLSLTASTPGPIGVDDEFTYTLELRNFSDADVANPITVTDQLPGNVAVTGSDCPGGSIADGRLSWLVDGISEGQTANCEISVRITAINTTGAIFDTAMATYTGASGQTVTLTGKAIVSTFNLPRVESRTLSGAPTTEDSIEPSLSADGSIVVFSSRQKDLVPLDSNDAGASIFLRDRRTGETRLISQGVGGLQLHGNGITPDISLNGQAAAFILQPASMQQGAKAGSGNGPGQLCSSQPNSLFQMTCADTGMNNEPLDGEVESPSLSADGKLLAFCSDASNWVADDTNGAKDVFVKDQATGVVTRVSVSDEGLQADGASCDPVISANGRFVTFTTQAPNLGGTTDARQIVRKDLVTGELLAVTSVTGEPADADAGKPSISTDGRRIAFTSRARNLLPGVGSGQSNLFVFQTGGAGSKDLSKGDSGNSLFVMRGPDDALPNGDSSDPKIACTGSAIGFTSDATNLVDGGNGQRRFFVYDLDTGAIVLPGSNTGANLDGDDEHGDLDCEATTGAYDSTGTGPGNPNPNSDVLSQEDPLHDGSGNLVLGSAYSGNWFDPGQSGHGFLLEALPDGDFYATWYTFSNGQPLFLQGRATPAGNTLTLSMFSARSTGFPVGASGASTATWGNVTLTFTSLDDATASWTPIASGFTPGTMNLHRLSRAALVQSNRDGVVDACNSGIWFDPAQPGYGFNIEINDMPDGNRIASAYWYTYQPDGTPLWLIGTGLAEPGGVAMDLYRFSGDGAQFPPAFSADALTPGKWGSATLTFASNALSVRYASTTSGYGSGSMELQRLTVLRARTCDE